MMASGLGRPLLPCLLDRVTCSVCMHQYDDNSHVPKLLPCQHTFCQSCVATVAKKGEQENENVECPICRQKYPVPADGFSTNRDLLDIAQELQEATSTVMLCDSHDGMECALFCMDCLQALCVRCLKGKQHISHQLEEVHDAKRLIRESFDANIKNKLLVVDQKISTIDNSSYSTAEVEKAKKIMTKICKDCEKSIRKWNENQLQQLKEVVKTGRDRDDAMIVEKTKLLSLLEQTNIDMKTMIEKLNDDHTKVDEMSKLCETGPNEYDLENSKHILDQTLELVFKQSNSSEFLKAKKPTKTLTFSRKFQIQKAVQTPEGVICEIDNHIMFYAFRSGKMELYDKGSDTAKLHDYASKLNSYIDVRLFPSMHCHIAKVKQHYATHFSEFAACHWHEMFE